MCSIVFITFHIGNFLSVSGFGHAICDSFRNEHVVILRDIMLKTRITKMNMRTIMVIMMGSIIMMNKEKTKCKEKEQEVSEESELHDFDNDNNDDEHDMTFIEVRDCSSLRSMPRSTKLSASGFG